MFSGKFDVKKAAFSSILLFSIFYLSQNVSASTITGTVFDNQRAPLVEVDVELLDDFYRLIGRTKTSGAGRYEFGGLRNGRFTVRVLPFRYDFMDASAEVEITTINSVPNQESNQFITQDFYLSPRKGSLTETELGVVFAQEVPKEAETVFKDAIKSLSAKRTDEGILGLRKSIAAFPKYYQALHRLGRELFMKGAYGEAAQVLLKASEINQKSPTTLYYLGYSLAKLNYNKAALIPLNQALLIAPTSVQVLFVVGTTEIAEGKYIDAEKHLMQAKTLSKTSVPDIHWHLAHLYADNLKKYKEAADELELYLKSGKFEDKHTEQVRKIITDLRKKSQAQGMNK